MTGTMIVSAVGGSVDTQRLSTHEAELAALLATGGRVLSAEGHDDMNQGQISARAPANRGSFLIKQVLAGFDEVTPGEFVRCSLDEHAPAHKLAPPEIPLHQAIYQARPDVAAIVHTHARATLAFGALSAPLEPLSHEGACFHGRYAVFAGTSHTVLDIAVGREVAAALGDKLCVFLRNHGVVVVGRTVREAVVLATVLERACELQLRVLATGQPYSVSVPADIEPKQKFIFGSMSIRAFWDYYVRRLKRSSVAENQELSWL
jgi:L-fuculose-phosphate aldolase